MLGEVGSSSAFEVIFTFPLANTLSLDASPWLVYAHSMIEINLSVFGHECCMYSLSAIFKMSKRTFYVIWLFVPDQLSSIIHSSQYNMNVL